MSTTMPVTADADARYSGQPVGYAGVQTAANVFTVYQEDDLFSASIPAVLGTNLLSMPVILDSRFLGIHASASEVSKVRCGTARSHDTAPRWNNMHTGVGTFVDAGLGAWLTAMKSAGAEVIYTVFGTPTWASARPSETGDPYGQLGAIAEPASMSNLAAFVTWLMTNYGSQIDYLEVWNEPKYKSGNSSYFSGTASKLAEMAKTINQAAKAVKPSVQIMGVGCTGVGFNGAGSGITYTDNFLAASDGASGFGKDWIDIISVHAYAHDGTNDLTQLASTKAWLDGIKSSNGVSGKDVWATEYGYITPEFSTYTGPGAARGNAYARYALWNVIAGMKRIVQYRYGGNLGWQADADADAAWNRWAGILNGATVSVINRIGSGRALAAVINGQRYIV